MFNSLDIVKFMEENNIEYFCSNKQSLNLRGFSPLKNTLENTVTWIKEDAVLSELKSSVYIINEDFREKFLNQEQTGKMLVGVENPRVVFAMLMKKIYKMNFKPSIASNASIASSSTIDKNVYIGSHTTIGENVIIRNGTYIHSNVVIHDNVEIGENCEIHSGAVIGSEGFGYERNLNGDYFNIPHIGGVTLNNNVSVGSNSCIDRGVLDNTIIGENTKIDNLCHIAHNCVIGKNNMITAATMIAGSVKTGDNVWFAPSSVIKNGLTIGSNSLVGLGAVATKNIEEEDIVAGVPAKSMKKK